jgi:hypothetical protein
VTKVVHCVDATFLEGAVNFVIVRQIFNKDIAQENVAFQIYFKSFKHNQFSPNTRPEQLLMILSFTNQTQNVESIIGF